jgi:hypothetical protein
LGGLFGMDICLLTITQGSRLPFFRICIDHVRKQTHLDRVCEWVIVDGSPEDCPGFEQHVKDLTVGLPVVFVPRTEGPKKTIGALRNLANRTSTKGSTMIWIDDDDYYGPRYLEYVSRKLGASSIAGCTQPFYYDLAWRCTFQYARGTPNLTTNNCMAYKRRYIDSHAYDEVTKHGEEWSFLDGLRETLVQLNPIECEFVGLGHPWNMCDKALIHLCAHYGLHTILDALPGRQVIPGDILKKYLDILDIQDRRCPYDIVYYTGGFGEPWDPWNEDLGGSEQAVVELSKKWALLHGKHVAVYGFFSFDSLYIDDVHYVHSKFFRRDLEFNVLILWRIFGVWPIMNSEVPVKARKIVVDLHDPIVAGKSEYHQTISKVYETYPEAVFAFRSKFHERGYDGLLNPLAIRRVVPNGVRDVFFSKDPKIPRIPMRFVYCSAYERGLVSILRHVWPHIVQAQPTAELHLYYGCKDPDVLQSVREAMSWTLNVMDHGRRGIRDIHREKQMSTYHLYTTRVPAETDCVSIKESYAAGCIPVVLREGVFLEHSDFCQFVDGDPDSKEGGKEIADQLLDLSIKASRRLPETWDTVATLWTTLGIL